MSDAGACAVCEAAGVVMVNGTWYCVDHVDDGFRATLRGLAVDRGIENVDAVEAKGVEMLEELERRRELDP